MSKKMADL